MLRIKVPSTFIHNSQPDDIFGNYDVRQLSVSANKVTCPETPLDFWTISSRMLNDYVSEDGYAYIFFAPDEYVREQLDAQGIRGQKRPPVYGWGNYTGYMLGSPDYAIMIRYRAPAMEWLGNPENPACPAQLADVQPVTMDELGEWLPQMYSDSLENFKQGRLGIISNHLPWQG